MIKPSLFAPNPTGRTTIQRENGAAWVSRTPDPALRNPRKRSNRVAAWVWWATRGFESRPTQALPSPVEAGSFDVSRLRRLPVGAPGIPTCAIPANATVGGASRWRVAVQFTLATDVRFQELEALRFGPATPTGDERAAGPRPSRGMGQGLPTASYL